MSVKYTDPKTVGAVLYRPLPHHLAGRSYTASGYGAKIPTRWMIVTVGSRDEGFRLTERRVYSMVYGNGSSAYVVIKGEDIFIDIDTEYRIQEQERYQAEREYADEVLAKAARLGY